MNDDEEELIRFCHGRIQVEGGKWINMDKVFSIYVSSDDIMIDCEDHGKWTVKRFKTKKDAENCLKKYFN